LRNAVRRKQNARLAATSGTNLIERRLNIFHIRFDEPGMIEKRPQLLHARRAGSHVLARSLDVFEILAASGVGTVSRGDERQGICYSVRAHLLERVREQRMPVSITKIDR